jgi:hypothetical protein
MRTTVFTYSAFFASPRGIETYKTDEQEVKNIWKQLCAFCSTEYCVIWLYCLLWFILINVLVLLTITFAVCVSHSVNVWNIFSYKNTNHQQMHKESFIINRNTLLHASTLLGHLQGELSVTVTLRLHFTVEWECAVDCVLRCFWRRELSAVRAGPHRRVHASSTQHTVNSTFSLKHKVQPCDNKKFSLKMTQQGRNM